MSNVYVVTTGDYSDYKIVAIFSEAKKEEAYKLDEFINDNLHRVEIWSIDKDVHYPDPLLVYYGVDMDRDGRVKRIWNLRDDYWHNEINLKTLSPYPTKWEIETYGNNILTVRCYARNENHAIKIANDYRVQLSAARVYELTKGVSKNFIDKDDVNIILTSQFKENR